jgi:Na+(H+)/acetate symporter ActP
VILTGLVVEGGHPTIQALLTQPAVVSVPVAFLTMIAVSLLDRGGRRQADPEMLALHVPEGLGLEAGRPAGLTSTAH